MSNLEFPLEAKPNSIKDKVNHDVFEGQDNSISHEFSLKDKNHERYFKTITDPKHEGYSEVLEVFSDGATRSLGLFEGEQPDIEQQIINEYQESRTQPELYTTTGNYRDCDYTVQEYISSDGKSNYLVSIEHDGNVVYQEELPGSQSEAEIIKNITSNIDLLNQ